MKNESAQSLARISMPHGGKVTIQMWDVIEPKPICFSFVGGAEIIVEQTVAKAERKETSSRTRPARTRKA